MSDPTDLKVKQGDVVEVGQVVAERVGERNRLEAERNSLNLQYQKNPLLSEIDQRIEEINGKIDEARATNKKAVKTKRLLNLMF